MRDLDYDPIADLTKAAKWLESLSGDIYYPHTIPDEFDCLQQLGPIGADDDKDGYFSIIPAKTLGGLIYRIADLLERVDSYQFPPKLR